jgi:hypothetical protein
MLAASPVTAGAEHTVVPGGRLVVLRSGPGPVVKPIVAAPPALGHDWVLPANFPETRERAHKLARFHLPSLLVCCRLVLLLLLLRLLLLLKSLTACACSAFVAGRSLACLCCNIYPDRPRNHSHLLLHREGHLRCLVLQLLISRRARRNSVWEHTSPRRLTMGYALLPIGNVKLSAY